MPKAPTSVQSAFLVYQLAWNIAIPFLRRNERLRQGFDERTLQIKPGPADLWIQSASVGEAFLSWELVKNLETSHPLRLLLTTNTSQGLEILQKAREYSNNRNNLKVEIAYFPFDKPKLMSMALSYVKPKVMVLMESEMWPGLMRACRRNNVSLLVANGRMTDKSLKRYMIWPSLWRQIRPNKVLAMSSDDALRFATLFGHDIVDTIHNMKFDRIHETQKMSLEENPLRNFISPLHSFIVLGSVRQEEEEDIAKLICRLKEKNKELVIGLFPRHMYRLEHWQKTLSGLELSWQLRSKITSEISEGQILLWDTMGELTHAYECAAAAFVGGSLAPLGGQNFLEPLTCGLKPVIGPSWSNFYWVGSEIIEQRLVLQAADWQETADLLLRNVSDSPDRQQIRQSIISYVENRKGGTHSVCNAIKDLLT